MTRRHLTWIALGCLALGGGACASHKEGTNMAPAPPRASLQCALSGPTSQKAGEPVELTFRLTNPTAQPVFVLKWHTPLEGLRNNFLEVKRDGTEVAYQGRMVKRGEPSAEEYVTLSPGASVEQKFEASQAYDFSEPGTYEIAFRGPLMDVATQQGEVPRTRETLHSQPLECSTVQTTITAP
jgi:hypothetical protein